MISPHDVMLIGIFLMGCFEIYIIMDLIRATYLQRERTA